MHILNAKKFAIGGVAALALAGTAGIAFAQSADIVIGNGVFPESIAATPDGGFVAGSVTSGTIYRYTPGSEGATPWATVDGITLGVFATDDTVYACVNAPTFGEGRLVTLDLATAEQTGSYAFPGGGLCNDIAISDDGTVYVTDTAFDPANPGRVLHLEGDALVEDLSDVAIGGADGLAFLDGVLYVNNVNTGEIYRIDMTDGAVSGYTTLTLDRPLAGPDGMRTASDGSGIYVAENAEGRVSKLVIDGDMATVETVGEGEWVSATSIAEVGGQLYVIDTQFPSMGAEGSADMPFSAIAVGGGM